MRRHSIVAGAQHDLLAHHRLFGAVVEVLEPVAMRFQLDRVRWMGKGNVEVRDVPDPQILNPA